MRKAQSRRAFFIYIILFVVLLVVIWRLVDLSIIQRPFLLSQSKARIVRVVKQPSHRGAITDRNGEMLAISIPVDAVWVNPRVFHPTKKQRQLLSSYLGMPEAQLLKKVTVEGHRFFVYLKRRVPTVQADKIKALHIKGLYLQREHRRYYPDAEVDAHILGFTNIDDQGQEGLELAYNAWLAGEAGARKVIKDRLGHVISDIAQIKKPVQGKPLVLSIDQRIQYLSYRDLDAQVQKYHAASGSIVVLDTRTGEIIAMVNVPSYNPNNRPQKHDSRYRNRAVTDIFEPGSTIKPFNIALALSSGRYTPDTKIDTNPGWMMIGGHEIKDDGLNYGVITLTQLLQKSSNIGAAKVMFSLSPDDYWKLLQKVGFGVRPGSYFPGESAGLLPYQVKWSPVEIASMSFGYGVSISPLQLAKAYAILANHGVDHSVSFLKRDKPIYSKQVIEPKVADSVLQMMRSVVESGTGRRARVPGYQVSGKTGTAYIAGPHGYDKKNPQYMSSFVGIAPASDPRLVVAVVIRDPKGQHFGAIVAAPLFAKVMGGALRVLNIMPDHYQYVQKRSGKRPS